MLSSLKGRVSVFIVGFLSLLLGYGYVYMLGMRYFEGVSVPYYVAVQKATEAVTTAGFGGHAPWESLGMNVMVIVMNLTGVSIFFFGIPIILAPVIVPYFREVFRKNASVSCDLRDHVIITEYSEIDRVLVEQLEQYGVSYVFLIEDEERALKLENKGIPVVCGNLDSVRAFERANSEFARAILVDSEDSRIPSIVLTASKAVGDAEIITVSSTSGSEAYHRLAGADDVFESKEELGRSLGLRSIMNVSEEIRSHISDSKISVYDKVIEEDSSFLGCSVSEAQVELSGSIIAGWFNGKFVAAPSSELEITENSILILAEYDPELDVGSHSDVKSDVVAVAGLGTVGESVVKTVTGEGHDVVTIDTTNPNADITGDIKDISTLRQLDASEVGSLIMTVGNDNDAIYGTLIVSKMFPEMDIIARVNEKRNVWKLYEAGADYVLPLETLAGDYLASRVIDNAQFISPTNQITVTELSGTEFDGLSLEESKIREEYGLIVIAIQRGGEYLFDIDGGTVIAETDTLIVIGERES